MARSRLSSTFMPPNSTKGARLSMVSLPRVSVFCAVIRISFGSGRFQARLLAGQRRFDVTTEEAVTVARRGGEFRVELSGHKPRMVGHFDHFHQLAIGA